MQSAPYLIMFGGIALLLVVPFLTRKPAVHADARVFYRSRTGRASPRMRQPRMPRPRAMIAVISLAVLGAALYVLVIRDDDPLWATSAVSTTLGYWLRAGTYS